jgi:hypothetical protein
MRFEQNVSVNKMYSLAIKNIFPKKKIIVKEEESFYTSILNFFNFDERLEGIPKGNMAFAKFVNLKKKTILNMRNWD